MELIPKDKSIKKDLIPKSEIIRCPACRSSNVNLGTKTVWGVPICCRECGHFEPTRR